MSDTEAPVTLGRYQIAEELGRGAMGVVYLGVDPVIARPVAIKVVKESEYLTPAEAEQFRARFRHEAEAAGRLSHPDIVQVFDIGDNYMVMEFIEGRPLSSVLAEGTHFSVRQILGQVQRAADAIDYAHRNGIVHRDIKPGNIMILDGGGLKVMDFGVARLDNSNLTAVGAVVGSVRYMAPEQMMGEKVDGRADTFSLAAVAYEMLTAHPPFPGKTITEVVSRVIRGGHVPPCFVESRLPPALDRVFAKAFAIAAADRYARAVDLSRELAEALRPVLDLELNHGPQIEIPTEVDGTAVEPDHVSDPGATASGVAALLPHDEDLLATLVTEKKPGKKASKTTAREAPKAIPAAPALDSTVMMAAPARSGSTTAKTVIMDAASSRDAVLMVESEPPGATVWVDGTRVGVTPLPDYETTLGRHEVRLEAERCDPVSLVVELSPERPLQALTVSLAPARKADGSVRPGQFVPFGPDVMPPCRISGALPAFPEGARERGLAGSPIVEVWVGEKGDVIDLAVVASAGAILDGALLDAVSQWRFTPARVRGVPVAVRVTIQHHFRS